MDWRFRHAICQPIERIVDEAKPFQIIQILRPTICKNNQDLFPHIFDERYYRSFRKSPSAFPRILDDNPWMVEMTRLSNASSLVRARRDELEADVRISNPSSM